jgi:IS30 family transposase
MQYQHLTIEERETIQTMWWERKSVRSIAKALGRSPSSVSREMRRNFPKEHKVYTPRLAHARALSKRKSRGRSDRLKNDIIRNYVISHLKLRWSPEQIAGRMKKDGVGNISPEAIYQYIYAHVYRNGWGLLRPGYEDLRSCLRRRKKRRTRKGSRRCQRIFKTKGISIEERPLIVTEKKRIGDWEGDSVESKDHKPGVNTLLERKTGFFLVTKVRDKTSSATTNAIVSRMRKLPEHIKCTLTIDNGVENSDWQNLERKTGLKTFFAHPYSSHERGANENTNGLLRDYYPKKTDFSKIPDEEISKVEYDLNTRPRKRLHWSTPLEEMSVALGG